MGALSATVSFFAAGLTEQRSGRPNYGNAMRQAVHDLTADDGNNDGSPTQCSVAALKALVQRLTRRMKIMCAQVAVRPLDDIHFPHDVQLEEDSIDESVKRFGTIVMKLVRQALSG